MLELLVVLVIISLATALVVPSITKGLEGVKLRAAASKVTALLRHARSLAVSRRAVYQVVVNPETRTIRLAGIEGASGSFDPSATVFDLPEGVQVKAVDPLAFFPTGSAVGGTLELEGEGGRTTRVQVDPITGLVRIVR